MCIRDRQYRTKEYATEGEPAKNGQAGIRLQTGRAGLQSQPRRIVESAMLDCKASRAGLQSQPVIESQSQPYQLPDKLCSSAADHNLNRVQLFFAQKEQGSGKIENQMCIRDRCVPLPQPQTSDLFFSPHSHIPSRIGIRDFPRSVRLYSTFGGI